MLNATNRNETPTTRPIRVIKIGNRHRHDLGNVGPLAASIADVGLLHPVVITPDGTLIAGARRIAACQQLGWSEIRVTVVNLDDIVRGEFAENAHRKDFLPSEIDAIRRALEPVEKAAAKDRMREGGKGVKVSQPSRATDKIGAFAGVSGRTIEKIAAVVDAAEADPEKYGKLKEYMDESGRVDGVFRKLKILKQAETIRNEPPPLPNRGPYRVIVVDAPWPYYLRRYDPSNRGACEYPLMSVEEICALPVSSIAHEDCILWLWTTNLHLPNAFKVLDAWGFEYKTMLTWAKNHIGTGDWLRGRTEHCLMAIRGKPTAVLTNETTLLMTPGGKHSEKPAEFYALVEKLCPAPRYAYLFARRSPGEKWSCHGDELKND
jgi:N6-adenosine-specific RNA methylase IME4